MILFLLAFNPLLAQKKPCFKILDAATGLEINAGCVGQRIRVINCEAIVSPTTIQYYDFDGSNGVPFGQTDTASTHTYTQAKTYRISFLPVDPRSSASDSTSKVFRVLPKPRPKFKVTACSQGNVQVTITDLNYDSFQVDFAGGATRTLSRGGSTSYQFAAGQQMQVSVTGKYSQAPCSMVSDTTVQALPLPQPPVLSKVQLMLPTPDGRISFTLDQLQSSYFYLLEKQTGTGFTVLDTIKNPATAQVTRVLNLVNARDQACYRIRATDRCGSSLNIVSNSICSLPVSIGGSQEIALYWPAYPEPSQLVNYQLYKDGKLLQTLPKNLTTFIDVRVTCQQQHCYELIAVLANNNQSVSNNPCITVNTSRPPVNPYITSTYTPQNQVELTLQLPTSQVISQITWQKSINGSPISDLGTSQTTTFGDNTVKKNQALCYQAVYQDSCNQTSAASNQTCPILLKTEQQDNTTILLSWSTYVGFTDAVQYVVQRLDADGQVLASLPAAGNAYSDTFVPDAGQRIFYRIQGLVSGQEATYSNTESVAFEAKVLVPTAFTPNGDNLNDVFEVKGRYIELTRMIIYDRWGQIIYQSQGQGWDGRIQGKPAPPGTYPYEVNWKEENGLINHKTGMVTLIK